MRQLGAGLGVQAGGKGSVGGLRFFCQLISYTGLLPIALRN